MTEVLNYTAVERGLLRVRPGITDFASIVFADEGEILRGADDPDARYNQLIRPWKSRLGLFYASTSSLVIDLQLIGLTAMALVSRPRALMGVQAILRRSGADAELVTVAGRTTPLPAAPPPGAEHA
jgi:lipopolysaccharide/colanic/teichoic acid biosynthesis glycosyltransferase